jgi:hypothetical protein
MNFHKIELESRKACTKVANAMSAWLSVNGATHETTIDLSKPEERLIHTVSVNGKAVMYNGHSISVSIFHGQSASGSHAVFFRLKLGDNVMHSSMYTHIAWDVMGMDEFVETVVKGIIYQVSVFSDDFAQFVSARRDACRVSDISKYRLNCLCVVVDPVGSVGVCAEPVALSGGAGAAPVALSGAAAPGALGAAAGAAAPAAPGALGAAAVAAPAAFGGNSLEWSPPPQPSKRSRGGGNSVGRYVAEHVKRGLR